MIPNHWYAILESNEVKRGKPIGVTRLGEKLVAWRDSHGRVTVMRDLCPHRGVALSKGEIRTDCIECPFHGFQFDTTGRGTLIPANGRQTPVPKAFQVHTYPTREAHDLIYVWYGEPRDAYPPLPWFDLIDESYSYATIRDHWTAHYSRAIENQLDVVHLPFIHRTTIGRGNQALVHGPISQLETLPGGGEMLNIWMQNEVDTGQTPLKSEEMPQPDRHPLLQFYFPNVWHNWLGDNLHIFIAFAPIDDENTMMYIRQYQRIVKTPVLREVFNIVGQIGNLIIERQDKRVVITQEPKRSALRMGEKLIQGDLPIIEYRRRREELIEQAG
jgi:phenylpropionate dioxygenase-like ring-hydroxylating dioxygenase large terminal subunit